MARSRDTEALRLDELTGPFTPEEIARFLDAGEERCRHVSPWGTARFKRQGGKWVPRSQPPVRLDGERRYSDFQEWLALSVERILGELESATALEVFSSLYATLDPWEALEHETILAHLERQTRARRVVGPPGFSLSADAPA